MLPGPEDYKKEFCNREAFTSMELVALATMCTQPGQFKRQKLKDSVKAFGDRMDAGGIFRVERKTLEFEFIMIFTWLPDEFCGEGFALKLLTDKFLSGSITDEIIELLNKEDNSKEDFIDKILKWFNVFHGSGRRNITKGRNK